MKVLTCYHCGSGERSDYGSENGYHLVKCSGCGLLYVEDRPDDTQISQAHKQGKHSGEHELDVTGRFDAGRVTWYLKVLEDLYGGDVAGIKSWLDVGCGHGEFVAAVMQYGRGGITVKGSEPNEKKQESARKRGLDVGYFDIESHAGRYDVVSLLNVYSHLPDPPGFIRSLKNLLNPGGELILETGDVSDLPAHKLYRPYSLPDHLSFASAKILTEMLERAGFEVVRVKKYPVVLYPFKEFVKLFVPGYRSMLRYLFMPPTDMYIRARLRS